LLLLFLRATGSAGASSQQQQQHGITDNSPFELDLGIRIDDLVYGPLELCLIFNTRHKREMQEQADATHAHECCERRCTPRADPTHKTNQSNAA
jgi:hypothetical protein